MVPPERIASAFTTSALFRFSVASASGLIDTGMAEWLNRSTRAVTKCLLRLKSRSCPASSVASSVLRSSLPVPTVTRLFTLAVA